MSFLIKNQNNVYNYYILIFNFSTVLFMAIIKVDSRT